MVELIGMVDRNGEGDREKDQRATDNRRGRELRTRETLGKTGIVDIERGGGARRKRGQREVGQEEPQIRLTEKETERETEGKREGGERRG